MIKFKCEFCGKKIGVPDEHAGKRAKCPGCSSPIRVPEPQGGGYELNLEELDAGGDRGQLVSMAAPAAGAPGAAPPEDDSFTVEPGRWDDENTPSKKRRAAAAAGGLLKVLVISAVVALIAGSVWAGVAIATGYQFSFLAILIGLAVGGACALVAQQQNPIIGFYAAGLTVVGILVGKVLIFNYFVPTTLLDLVDNAEEWIADDEFWVNQAVSEQMREDKEFDEDIQQFADDLAAGDAWEKYSDRQWEVYSRKQERQVEAKVASLGTAEREQIVADYKIKQEAQSNRMTARLAVSEQMEDEGRLSPEVAAFVRGDIDDVSDENLERLEKQLESEIDAEMDTLSDAEIEQIAETYSQEAWGEFSGFADGISTLEKIKLLTDWTDIIFFLVAISAAFQVGTGGWLDN